MINPSAGRALFLRIADDLRERIRNGHLAPGASLPSEKDLGFQYSAGRHAVRDAIDRLVAEGLLLKHPGRATQVRQTPPMARVRVDMRGREIGGRGATEPEAAEYGIPVGDPMLTLIEVGTGLELDAWPADRTRIRDEADASEADRPDSARD